MKRISLVRLPGNSASSGASAQCQDGRATLHRRPLAGPLDHRMTDKDGLQPVFLEERHLEGKQRQHQIEIAGHFFGAIGTRRPDLWRDIIHGADGWITLLIPCATRWVKSGLSITTTTSGRVFSAKFTACFTRPRIWGIAGTTSRRPITAVVSRDKGFQTLTRHRQPAHAGKTDAVAGRCFSPPSAARPARRPTARRTRS